ncbi:catechol 1,2-dioxygenase [Amycolatopsis bartoniae]|uniref:6-chlorohydroxyquinol-1,2-dioxygenase n=1 Tax=Amycolatopsis bartoniae TaxID=941986 RepID=A0A8H9IU91_9PSEU|nr:dioxygenase [Amycolatopsis bartoniae]MBB2940282.1 catechol 1,2-dioxygenase [Amycolatopsis bartoniae]TVT09474.1 6-chlorohydroxyquinol-1,2-dioxygenase [Amycolatopsis bartoniae]GHF53526.1 6-chlorohydroxyquinol-1,2-dioxygenase [Amycolatopsis bartoniae]
MNPDERLDALLASVLGQIRGSDPRLNELVSSLVRHLHAFVRETRPTETEWLTGIDFLVRTGQTCTEHRNEVILLSDMLGLTSAVDDVNHAGPAGATPSSVEGPFHSPAPPRENGAWISNGPERERGQVMVVHGRVTDTGGHPLAGATVDIWQADDAGFYDSQDPAQEPGNLRGLFTTGADGAYWFRSIVPSSYPVPTDGPVGELLRGLGRHPMRPAHIHYRVEAPGHRPVTTHVFVAGDAYLGSDAAFAVKEELIVTPVVDEDPGHAAAFGVDGPFADFAFDVRLVAQ